MLTRDFLIILWNPKLVWNWLDSDNANENLQRKSPTFHLSLRPKTKICMKLIAPYLEWFIIVKSWACAFCEMPLRTHQEPKTKSFYFSAKILQGHISYNLRGEGKLFSFAELFRFSRKMIKSQKRKTKIDLNFRPI